MELQIISLDFLALAFFLICVLLSIYFREKARRLDVITGKKIRSHYRHDWAVNVLKNRDTAFMLETVRNNVLVTSGMITALVISFGFVINSGANILAMNGDFALVARTILTISLLAYAFFMILLEARTLVYIPIIFGTSDKLINKHEGMKKVDYLAKLMHEAFDHFSNAIRALVFIMALLVWFYSIYAFIVFTALITYLMVREDFGKKSEIVLF